MVVTQDVDLTGFGYHAEKVGIEGLKLFPVGRQQYVAVTEAQFLSLLVELHALSHLSDGHIGLTPGEQHHRVDEKSQQEINQYATNHD